MRLLLLDAARSHAVNHKNVNLNIYIDDLSLDVSASDKHTAIRNMSAAAEDLAFKLEYVHLPLAKDKTVVLSNNKSLSGLLRRCLKGLGGPPLGSVRALRVDFWAASPRKTPPMRVRKSSFNRLAQRRPRIKMLARASRVSASKVFVCGILPSALFDAPIFGVFGNSLRNLRRETGVVCGFAGKKRTLDLAFSMEPDKDPEVVASLAVISRLSKEVWNASLPLKYRNEVGISLGTLASGIAAYLQLHDGPPAEVCGPISAFHTTLGRAGWNFVSPFEVSRGEEGDVHLLWNCPKKVTALFKNDLVKAIAMRPIHKMHSDRPTLETDACSRNGIFLQPLVEMYKKVSARDKQTLLAIVTDGMFADFDLFCLGYNIDPSCKLCGASHDTIYHRCCSCPAVEGRARVALGEELFNDILAKGEDSLLANRCIMGHPVIAASPAVDGQFVYVNTHPGDMFRVEDGGIFGDGSASNPSMKCLSRGGFSIVQINNDGNVKKRFMARSRKVWNSHQ